MPQEPSDLPLYSSNGRGHDPGGARRALRNSEQRLREVLETAPSPFVALDAEGLVLDWNLEAEETFGWRRCEAVGRRFVDCMIAPGAQESFEAQVAAAVDDPDEPHRRIELDATHRDGRAVPVEVTLSRLRAGATYIVQAFIRDLTETMEADRGRRAAEDRVAHMALHDALTGLPNRGLLFDRLVHALASARRRTTSLAVLFIDLDNFRLVNESRGHEAGDELLVEVARRLSDVIRRSDTMARMRAETVVRFGGDEFVIVCEDVEDEDQARAIAERIEGTLADAFALAGEELAITASVGIAMATGSTSPDAAISQAEAAMYQAKERGRARHEVFDAAAAAQAFDRPQRESELSRAIEHDELRLFFQPIVSVADGGLVGAEALVRWEHPERGLLAPAQFLPLAEESGLIVPLGLWVLREACTQAARWQAHRPDGLALRIAVNVSAHQLAAGDLDLLVTDALTGAHLDPSRLVLEITESVFVQDSALLVQQLEALRALGVGVSLDDFGSGYSSLSYLRRLPFDTVKLDRAFISGLAEAAADRQIVAAIVQMACALAITVVAEGVETAEQWACVRELGCHLAQGYHFARPMPGAQMSALVADASARGGLLRVPPSPAAVQEPT